MKYFSWNFYNNVRLPILEIGFTNGGDPFFGGTIVSYLESGQINELDYSDWNLKEITEEEALNIAKITSASAYVREDGRIDLML
jgi:hypothetical protein